MPWVKLVNVIKDNSKFNDYKQTISVLTKRDTYFACLFAFFVLLFMLTLLHYFSPILNGIELRVLMNFSLLLPPIFVIVYFEHEVSTIGFLRVNLFKSLVFGFIVGILFFLMIGREQFLLRLPHQIIPYLIRNAVPVIRRYPLQFLELTFFIAIIPAFAEEIFFRGYIQTRLSATVKNDILCILIGALIFVLFHIPSRVFNVIQLSECGLSLFSFLSFRYYFQNYFYPSVYFFWIIMHFIFSFSHRIFNNLAAPIIIHFFLDLRGLFVV